MHFTDAIRRAQATQDDDQRRGTTSYYPLEQIRWSVENLEPRFLEINDLFGRAREIAVVIGKKFLFMCVLFFLQWWFPRFF